MKNYKRSLAIITAAFLAAAPIAVTGMTAVAEGSLGVINIEDDTATTHTYKAYPIITGTPDGAGKLKDLAWAAGFDSASFITALNTDATRTALGISTDREEVPNIASVDDAAKVLQNIPEAKREALAKLVNENKGAAVATVLPYNSTSKNYTANVDDGWYLILDETDLTEHPEVKVKSANILEVTGTTNMKAKHNLPTLDKVIDDGSDDGTDVNTAAIGDAITYNIKLKVPNVTGYDKYYYVVEDTLSAGLTYNKDMTVTINGDAINEDTDGVGTSMTDGDFYVTENNGEIKVVFKDAAAFFKTKEAGDDIVITYSATLNSNAVITDAGNPNKAKLVYSNDPNANADGTSEPGAPDEPTSDSPTGETPEDEVTTYTTAVKLFKKDQSGNALTGAEFTLTGENLVNVKVVSGSSFVADADGTYYLLKNDTYTTSAPVTEGTGANADLYQSTTQKYKKVDTSGAFTEAAGSTGVKATVDSNGFIVFSGLKPGQYTLEETVVPEGYNKADDITFTITANNPLTGPSHWTSGNDNVTYITADNAFYVEIENRYGATLPSTGGIGTKLFYIFGSLLVVGSGVLLITKKRMNTKEN